MTRRKGDYFTLKAEGVLNRTLVQFVRQSQRTATCTVRVVFDRAAYKKGDTIHTTPPELRHEKTRERPEIGEDYFPRFESEFDGSHSDELMLKIKEVEQELEGNGWMIVASDGTIYDCFWSEQYQLWVYHVE